MGFLISAYLISSILKYKDITQAEKNIENKVNLKSTTFFNYFNV